MSRAVMRGVELTGAEIDGEIVNEEWEHRRYAERDLAVLAARAAPGHGTGR